MANIQVYGASWCPDCRRAKKFLADQRVGYEWFDFVGLDPNTSFLKDIIDLDAQGFVVTDPAKFESSLSGVFAAGDVRLGSTKQLASAVGEGAAVAIQIRNYLDSMFAAESM